MTTTTLLVNQRQLSEARLREAADAPLASGQVRVRVDSFALTANNITYAAFGDAMHYWDFFPSGEAGWGVVPVWGFGTVVQSMHPGVAVGEKLWGYWPMANHVVLQPDRLRDSGFVDGAEHRAQLPPVYNMYTRTNQDPFSPGVSDALQSLLRPLFVTSWLIDDFLADNDFFGAKTVLLSSASSKTAYGTAFMLAQRDGIEVVGVTSARNRAFCEGLGCYTRVIAYDELDAIAADTPCVYVDFAGNADFRAALHARFTQLKYSCSVGGTHVENLGGTKGLPGPRPVLFFAPAQHQKRSADWGGAELGKRMVAGWHTFAAKVKEAGWVDVQQHAGPRAALDAYGLVHAGKGDAKGGHILSLA